MGVESSHYFIIIEASGAGEAAACGERKEDWLGGKRKGILSRDIVRDIAERELTLGSHYGELISMGCPILPPPGPPRFSSTVTEKWRWLYPWDWQPPSLVHAFPRPYSVARSHFTGHRSGLERKSEGPVHGKRSYREGGGLGPHDGQVITRTQRGIERPSFSLQRQPSSLNSLIKSNPTKCVLLLRLQKPP